MHDRGFTRFWGAALVTVVACARASAEGLRIGLNTVPETRDPTVSRTVAARVVLAGLCDKLFDLAADTEIMPQLAASWSWSPDNKSLTLAVRSGVRHFTAEALKRGVYLHPRHNMFLSAAHTERHRPALEATDGAFRAVQQRFGA